MEPCCWLADSPNLPSAVTKANLGKFKPIYLGGALVVAYLGLLAIFDQWFVTYDGSAYMSVAANVVSGNGLRFPDASPMASRGPVYPFSIALGWLVMPADARSAIWISRAGLIFLALVVAVAAWRSRRHSAVFVVSGSFVMLQPLVFVSGGLFLVPDGLAAGLAVGAALAGVEALRRDSLSLWLVSGMAAGAAYLTKESLVLVGLVPLGLALVSGLSVTRRAIGPILTGGTLLVMPWWIWVVSVTGALPPPFDNVGSVPEVPVLMGVFGVVAILFWTSARKSSSPVSVVSPRRVLAVASLLGAVSIGMLTVFGAPLLVANAGVWADLRASLQAELYGESLLWTAVPAALLLLGVGVTRAKYVHVAAALMLSAIGAAGLFHGAMSGFGVRNGVLLVGGLGWLIGEIVSAGGSKKKAALRAMGVAVLLIAGVGGLQAISYLNSRQVAAAHSWVSPPIAEAAEWLARERPDERIASTPVYASAMWLLADGELNTRLLPIFEADRPLPGGALPGFDRVVWWLAHQHRQPSGEAIVAMTLSRKFVSVVFEEDLLEVLDDVQIVVVSGNLGQLAGPYEGGPLVPYLEAAPWARRIYASARDALPHWILVYEIIDSIHPVDHSPIVYVPGGYEIPDLPGDRLTIEGYSRLVLDWTR